MNNTFSFHVSVADAELRSTTYADLKRKVLRSAEAAFIDMYSNALREILRESLRELEGTENETL